MRTICRIWAIVVFFVMFQVVQSFVRRRIVGWCGGTFAFLVALATGEVADARPVILNSSFEVDAFYNATNFNYGYLGSNNPAAITGWLGGSGVASAQTTLTPASPFADNGLIPDGYKTCFMLQTGSLSQTIGGFKSNNLYRVVYYENARADDGSTGNTSFLQVSMKDQQTQQSQVIVSNHQVTAIQSAGIYTAPYPQVQSTIFAATAEIMTLTFQKTGSGTALIDNVQIQTVVGTENDNPPVALFGSYNTAVQYVPATPTVASQKQSLSDVSGYCNLAWIENYDQSVVPPSGARLTSTNACALIDYAATNCGMKSIMAISFIFFDGSLNLYLNWQQRWDSYSSNLVSRATNIAAFYTMDEPFGRAAGVKASYPQFNINSFLANLGIINRYLKSCQNGAFSNIPVAVCFDAPSLSDTPTFPFVIPDGYDWVGVSAYPVLQGQNYDHYLGRSVPDLYSRLKSYMKPGQRLMYVPETMLANNLATGSLRFDVLNNLDRTMYLAQNDPLSVAVTPYVALDDNVSHGFRNVPWLLKKASEIGRRVLSRLNSVILTPRTTYAWPTSADNGANAFDNNTGSWSDSGLYAASVPILEADYGQTLQANAVRIVSHNQGIMNHDIWVGSEWYGLNKIATVSTSSNSPVATVAIPAAYQSNVRFVVVQANPSSSTASETVQWAEIQLISGGFTLLPIWNGSFENPALAFDVYSAGIPGWTSLHADAGVQNLNGDLAWFPSVPDGNNVAQIVQDDQISQTLTNKLTVGTYNLSAYVAAPGLINDPRPFALQLWAGNSMLAQATGTGMVGMFSRFSTTYRALPNDPKLGLPLKVVFKASTSGAGAWTETSLDDVQLNFVSAQTAIAIATQTGTNFTFRVDSSLVGFNYVLEATPILSSGAWTAIQTNAGNDGILNFTNAITFGNPQQFFRVKIQ